MINKQLLSPSLALRSTGFTLLELLIAISLTAVLMTTLVLGLNQMTRDWEKHGQKLDKKLDESLILLQIEKALLGTYPYYYKENSLQKESLFFSGSQSELHWISTMSPGYSNELQLWSLSQLDEGGIMLNVEGVYPGDLQKQIEQVKEKQQKIKYFPEYNISLSYLSENQQNMKQWSTHWDAQDEKKLPIGVRIVFQQQDGDQTNDYELFSFIRAKGQRR